MNLKEAIEKAVKLRLTFIKNKDLRKLYSAPLFLNPYSFEDIMSDFWEVEEDPLPKTKRILYIHVETGELRLLGEDRKKYPISGWKEVDLKELLNV